MSGGSLDYFYSRLEEHIGDFKDVELDDLVKDLVKLFHDREWYLSCDICEGAWRQARDEFKKKWFMGQREQRLEKYLNTMMDEIREQLGVNYRCCENCAHWESEGDDEYGKCEYVHGCSFHRKERCGKWEVKDEHDIKSN